MSLRINVGYTNSFSVCFFVNTYDTVHNVLIKIHIVFTIAYNTRMELAEIFFSQKSVIARKRSVTPFFWAKRPLSPSPQKTASAAKPILACFYKTLTMGARRSCGQFWRWCGGDQNLGFTWRNPSGWPAHIGLTWRNPVRVASPHRIMSFLCESVSLSVSSQVCTTEYSVMTHELSSRWLLLRSLLELGS